MVWRIFVLPMVLLLAACAERVVEPPIAEPAPPARFVPPADDAAFQRGPADLRS